MHFKRTVIPATISLLLVLLAVMSWNLWQQLKGLSTAGAENLQWTILQVDTEMANLHATLLEQAARNEPDVDVVRLRTDIALSRIELLNDGNARDTFFDDAEGRELLTRLDRFTADAAAIVDSDAMETRAGLARLLDLTAAVRPTARRAALFGNSIGAERSEAAREAFAHELRQTGFVAIILIGALSAALLALNRLLHRARLSDRALKSSRARLASTVDASLDAILTSNARGEIVEVNPTAERILRRPRNDVIGLTLQEVIIPSENLNTDGSEADCLGSLATVVNAGRTEVMAQRGTGERFPAEVNITSVRDGDERLYVVYLRDISHQKINEQKLIDAKDRAVRTDRAKSQFMTIMSHEMRTPLTGILGVLDLLRTTRLTDQQSRHVDVATASGQILLEHVNEALDIARIETGSMTLSSQRFNLAETVEQVALILEPLAQEKHLRLDVEVADGMSIDFVGDGARTGQIVTNLIGNAIKFTDSGAISVHVSGIHAAEATTAKIEVRDTGVGISEAHIDRIFEDFVAIAHPRGRQSRGDGLGLSISRKIARLMGGDLSVASIPSEGSTFTLSVPLERASPKPRTSAPPERDGDAFMVAGQPRRVLVVEDNSINLSVLSDMLGNLGHQVHVAVDGEDGVDAAERLQFDLIIMDISMPKMDGIEATQRIRKGNGPNRVTRIQGLTAHGHEEYGLGAEAAGMNGVSTKPIRLKELQQIVEGRTIDVSQDGLIQDAFDDEVERELIGALGPEKTRETVESFFRELDRTMTSVRCRSTEDHWIETSAELHKLRGAADLLGFRHLSGGLEQMRSFAHAEEIDDFRQASGDVVELALAARTHMLRFIDVIAAKAPENIASGPCAG